MSFYVFESESLYESFISQAGMDAIRLARSIAVKTGSDSFKLIKDDRGNTDGTVNKDYILSLFLEFIGKKPLIQEIPQCDNPDKPSG